MAVGEKKSPLHIWSKKKGWFGGKVRKAEKQAVKDAKSSLNQSISDFEGLDTSNIYADAKNVYAGAKNVYADATNAYAGAKNQFAGAQNQFAGAKNQFANLENTAEDLTVNTQQADFEREQFQQSQANIMQNLQGAAGGSGVAGLAQALANQGAQQARSSSASIGAQESQNQAMAAQQAGANQMASAQGEQTAASQRMQGAASQQQQIMQGAASQQAQIMGGAAQQQQMVLGGAADQQNMILGGAADQQNMVLSGEDSARNLEYQKQQGIIGLRSGQLESAAETQRYNSFGAQLGRGVETVGGIVDIGAAVYGASDRKLKKNIKSIGRSPSGLNIYSFEYKNADKFGEGVYQGVMSNEVPSNAVINTGSYDAVDYSKIDVEFKQI